MSYLLSPVEECVLYIQVCKDFTLHCFTVRDLSILLSPSLHYLFLFWATWATSIQNPGVILPTNNDSGYVGAGTANGPSASAGAGAINGSGGVNGGGEAGCDISRNDETMSERMDSPTDLRKLPNSWTVSPE
uniref:Uncharacterized protein n=1 Tax=Lygus hesperus TaxID=30085 RepID=A0A0A9Y562_LYGHE